MEIRVSVTSQGPATPLVIGAFGLYMEVSGLGPGGSVVISGSGPAPGFESATAEAPVEAIGQPLIEIAAARKQAGGFESATVEAPVEAAGQPAIEGAAAGKQAGGFADGCGEVDEGLFQKLAALRKKVSSEAGVPQYVVFHDSTLRDMCRLRPADLESLKAVPGVGKAKLEKYGGLFIEALKGQAHAGGPGGA